MKKEQSKEVTMEDVDIFGWVVTLILTTALVVGAVILWKRSGPQKDSLRFADSQIQRYDKDAGWVCVQDKVEDSLGITDGFRNVQKQLNCHESGGHKWGLAEIQPAGELLYLGGGEFREAISKAYIFHCSACTSQKKVAEEELTAEEANALKVLGLE
jgi:hypothetical protein